MKTTKGIPRPRATKQDDGTWSLPVVGHPTGMHATSIEWADFSCNPIRAVNNVDGRVGWICSKVSRACAGCYAEAVNRVYGNGLPFTPAGVRGSRVVLDEQRIAAALRWKPASTWSSKSPDGRPKIFPCDMTDWAGEFVPEGMMVSMMALFILRPDCDWMPLTKRPQRVAELLSTQFFWEKVASVSRDYAQRFHPRKLNHWRECCERLEPMNFGSGFGVMVPKNVWHGATIEDSLTSLERFPHLLRIPAAIRYVSAEPLSGRVLMNGRDNTPPAYEFALTGMAWSESNLRYERLQNPGVHWVIGGCESSGQRVGPSVKPDDYWKALGHLRDDLAWADIAFFHKQWPDDKGAKVESDLLKCPEPFRARQWPQLPAF